MLAFKKKTDNKSALIDLFDQILKLEYSMIVNYPRIARMIKDRNTKELTIALGTASIKHADIVADASLRLGGNPVSRIENLPDNPNLLAVFGEQLEKERLALQLHQKCADLVNDPELKFEFSGIAEEEKSHIKTVEKILSNLKRGAETGEIGLLYSHARGSQ